MKEIEEMIVTVDKNKDGKINYSEFRVGFANKLNEMNDKFGSKLTHRIDIAQMLWFYFYLIAIIFIFKSYNRSIAASHIIPQQIPDSTNSPHNAG